VVDIVIISPFGVIVNTERRFFMADLKIIENELVPVYETEKGIKVVYGKDLHKSLAVKTDFSTWVKRRLSECDAEEKEDFDLLPKIEEQVTGSKHTIEYLIKLDTAKEMAMLERNDKGKQVRKYFIQVEEKYKQTAININQLSPELQMFNQIFQQVAKTELEQKKLAERADQQEKNMKTIIDTFKGTDSDVGTEKWVNRCISKIAESDDFSYSFGNKYAAARNESYRRLSDRAGCRLDQQLRNAISRAEERGCTKAQTNQINKLSVIMQNKRLKEIYVSVIKEMMIAYRVEIA
jgi:phage anti-repressor protein